MYKRQHIHKCSAPCQGYISREEYLDNFNKALSVLSGNSQAIISKLKENMRKASDNMEFEKAAVIRDQIKSIKAVSEKQKASGNETEERDIIAMASEEDEAVVQVLSLIHI